MARQDWAIPLGVIAFIVVSAVFFRYRPDSAGDVAAWVQAIGSIGAILAAIWIASSQHRENQRARKQERIATQTGKLASVFAIGKEAQRLLDRLPGGHESEDMARGMVNQSLDRNSIEDVHNALDKFQIDQLQDADAIVAVFEIKRSLRGVQFDYDAVQQQLWNGKGDWRQNAKEIRKRQIAIDAANLKIAAAIERVSDG